MTVPSDEDGTSVTDHQAGIPLVLRVFGGRKGETIVLRLPDGTYGVVDCYASSLADPTSNPAYKILNEEGIRTLQFVGLTHPHDDHYRGMSHLLRDFTIQAFWTFCDTFPDDLRLIVNFFRLEATDLGGGPQVSSKADELQLIFNRLKELETNGMPILAARSNQRLYPIPTGLSDLVEVFAVAPTHTVAREYVRSLLKYLQRRLEANAASIPVYPHRDHNLASIALLIRYGDARIILGGDVETPGWQKALAEFMPEFLAADIVKVSHHGSTNGYCTGLWSTFVSRKQTIAVLTPYHRHHLPETTALDEISRYARTVYSVCANGHQQAVRDWRRAVTPPDRLESFRRRAQAKLQQSRVRPSVSLEDCAREAATRLNEPRIRESASVGHCEFRVFPNGQCHVVMHGDAVMLANSE